MTKIVVIGAGDVFRNRYLGAADSISQEYGFVISDVVDVRPPSEILNERKGTMPTPRGPLAVEWQVSREKYTINLSIPANTTLKVNVDSFGDVLLDQITNNGIVHSGSVSEYLRLETGEYEIEIPRRVRAE